MNTFEGVFEFADCSVRRLQNGNKLKVVLESFEDIEVEKKIIEFRGCLVKLAIALFSETEETPFVIESNFELFETKCKRLKNGNKLQVVFEKFYDRDVEKKAVDLRFKKVEILMEKVERTLDFENDEESEEGEEVVND